MTISKKPYLLRAMRKWIIDSGNIPHIAVDTSVGGCKVPAQHIEENNRIVLNVSDVAAWDLLIGQDTIMFGAKFQGEVHDIVVPTGAVVAIYARETGQGMIFETEVPQEPVLEPTKHAHLKVVK